MLILDTALGNSRCVGGVQVVEVRDASQAPDKQSYMCFSMGHLSFSLCSPAPQLRYSSKPPPHLDAYGGWSSFICSNSSPKVAEESMCKMPRRKFPIGLYPPAYSSMGRRTGFLHVFICSFISPTFIGCVLPVRLWDRHWGSGIIENKGIRYFCTQGAHNPVERKTSKDVHLQFDKC